MALYGQTASPQRQGVYYGWYIVATAMFIAAVTTGARNGFGVFVIPMSDAFEWSRTTISVAAGIGWLVNGVTQPFLGHLFDKFNSRKVVLLSLLVVGLATAGLSLTFHYLFLVFLFSFVLSTAMSGASIGTLMPLLARWFRQRRTFVLGLVAAGTSIGGLVLIPFSGYLVDLFNWRVSWIALGAIVTFLALPMGMVFLRNNPSEMGLLPDGERPEPQTPGDVIEYEYIPPGAPGTGGDAAAAKARIAAEDPAPVPTQRRGLFEVDVWWHSFKSPPIWNLSIAYTVCGITVGLISIHFVPYAQEHVGVSATLAATIFGILTGLNVIGAIGGGWLADRFRRKNVLGTVYAVRGIAYLVLILGLIAVDRGITLPIIGSPGLASLWFFAVLAGFSWIASVPITASLTADVYGLRAMATISGISFLCHQVGAFVSIILAGVLYDRTGSYLLPFTLAGLMLIPASIASFTINERKYSVRYQTAPASAAGAAAGD